MNADDLSEWLGALEPQLRKPRIRESRVEADHHMTEAEFFPPDTRPPLRPGQEPPEPLPIVAIVQVVLSPPPGHGRLTSEPPTPEPETGEEAPSRSVEPS